jgi:hypothetical protein
MNASRNERGKSVPQKQRYLKLQLLPYRHMVSYMHCFYTDKGVISVMMAL